MRLPPLGRGSRDPPGLLFRGRGSGPRKGGAGRNEWPPQALISAKLDCCCWARLHELSGHDQGVGGGTDGREVSRGRPPPQRSPCWGPHPGPRGSAPRAAVWPLLPLPLEPLGKVCSARTLLRASCVQGKPDKVTTLRGPCWAQGALRPDAWGDPWSPTSLKVVLRLDLKGKADISHV